MLHIFNFYNILSEYHIRWDVNQDFGASGYKYKFGKFSTLGDRAEFPGSKRFKSVF